MLYETTENNEKPYKKPTYTKIKPNKKQKENLQNHTTM